MFGLCHSLKWRAELRSRIREGCGGSEVATLRVSCSIPRSYKLQILRFSGWYFTESLSFMNPTRNHVWYEPNATPNAHSPHYQRGIWKSAGFWTFQSYRTFLFNIPWTTISFILRVIKQPHKNTFSLKQQQLNSSGWDKKSESIETNMVKIKALHFIRIINENVLSVCFIFINNKYKCYLPASSCILLGAYWLTLVFKSCIWGPIWFITSQWRRTRANLSIVINIARITYGNYLKTKYFCLNTGW